MQNPRILRAEEPALAVAQALARGELLPPPPIGWAHIVTHDAARGGRYGIYPTQVDIILDARSTASLMTERHEPMVRAAAAKAGAPDARALSAVLFAASVIATNDAADLLKRLAAVSGVILTIIFDGADSSSFGEHRYYLMPVIGGEPSTAADAPTAGATRH